MTTNSQEIELKLQLCDELTDVLQIHQEQGPILARAELRRLIDNYPPLYQDARILLIICAIERLIEGSAGIDSLEIAEWIGNAEVAIAGKETA